MTPTNGPQAPTTTEIYSSESYLAVSRAVFAGLGEQLTNPERWVLLALASLVNSRNQAWPSHSTIAYRAGISVSSVKRAIAGLERRGLIEKRSNFGNSSTYVLSASLTASERGLSEAPSSGWTTTTPVEIKSVNRNKEEGVVGGQSGLGRSRNMPQIGVEISEEWLEFVQPLVDYCLDSLVRRGLKEKVWADRDRNSDEWRYPFFKLLNFACQTHHDGEPQGLEKLAPTRWTGVIDGALDAMIENGHKRILPVDSDLFHELEQAALARDLVEVERHRDFERAQETRRSRSVLTFKERVRESRNSKRQRQDLVDMANGWAVARGQAPHESG